jgi:hypothetical protein
VQHKRQHYVPKSYLKAWQDPTCPPKQTPYVWIFPKEERNGRRKSPEKILRETDMYTIHTDGGGRDLGLETNLSRLEREFSKLRRGKLAKRLPLSDVDVLHLCMFAASMLARTKGHAAHTSGQWRRVLEMGEKMEQAMAKASPEQRARMAKASRTPGSDEENRLSMEDVQRMVDQPTQEMLPATVTGVSPMLLEIPFVIAETLEAPGFITSDDPCVWFDPANYLDPPPRDAGGLLSPTIEIALPLSPNHMLYFSRKHVSPYIYLPIPGQGLVDQLNARTRAFAHEFFIANQPEARAEWF